MKSSLQSCIEKLDDFGLDALDVGCRWQGKPPLNTSDSSEIVTGLLTMVASAMLLYVLNELARSYFKPPSS
ncbi:MAG: hypothetical protein ACR2FS_14150 [Phormidesmis sp.]